MSVLLTGEFREEDITDNVLKHQKKLEREAIDIPFNHVIVEVHCLHGLDESKKVGAVPEYCKYGAKNPGYHCLKNNCLYVGHAPAPNEIAFSGENGEVEDDAWIGFGGEMEPEVYSESKVKELKELWKEVCKDKIQEAYDDYMLRSKSNSK